MGAVYQPLGKTGSGGTAFYSTAHQKTMVLSTLKGALESRLRGGASMAR